MYLHCNFAKKKKLENLPLKGIIIFYKPACHYAVTMNFKTVDRQFAPQNDREG